MGVGLSIGVAIGVALGPLFENIAIGSGIGASLEQRYKDNIRPLTEQEHKRERWAVVVGLLVMLASVIAIVLLLFSRIK
jgi:hypothetical protein